MTGSAPPQLGRQMPRQGSGDGNDFALLIYGFQRDCCVGGRTVGPTVAWNLVQTFLAAEFSQGRDTVPSG
jgi:hypothetical protein